MKSIFTFGLLFSSSLAFGWGPNGHRIVGNIAEKFLTIEALVKSRSILGGMTLDRASTWADEIRSDPQTYSYTFNWHFTEWPLDRENHDHSHEEVGQLLSSIKKQTDVLSSKISTNEEKAFAIKFLAHLIGDLHQPLHVGNGLDMGGNNCRVSYFGQNTNLHKVWDDDMIESQKLSYTEYVKFLMDELRGSGRAMTYRSGTPADWARESRELREQIYPAEVIKGPTSSGLRKYCEKSPAPGDIPKIGYEYNYKLLPDLNRRLLQGGIRLAVILNEALKD